MGLFDLFSLAPPKAPVTGEDRVWTEESLLRLARMLGAEPLLGWPLILPTSEFFPVRYGGTDAEVDDVFGRVCRYMHVDPATISLRYFQHESDPIRDLVPFGERKSSGPAALYMDPERDGTYVLALEERTLDDPLILVASIAHELGHVRLLGGGHLAPGDDDHEPLTDLYAVFAGMGIFTANAAFQFSQWSDGSMQGWSAQRHGYLSEPVLGYALACYAWVRGDDKPRWDKHLEPGIEEFFRKSVAYLAASGSQRLAPLREQRCVAT